VIDGRPTRSVCPEECEDCFNETSGSFQHVGCRLMATIRDVALRAGVSAGTVSNVLNRPSYVSAETRQRVLDAIDELGFVPNESSRQFRPGRVRTIGMVVVDLGNPFFVDVALGAEAMARESGAAFLVCNSAEDPVLEERNLDLLVQQRVQGVLITPVDEQNQRLDALLERGVPVVLLDRVSPDRNCCSVVTNDVYGGQLAGRHLVEQGHERIAFVGDPSGLRQMHDRYEGFLQAVGPDRSEVIPASTWRLEMGRSAGRELAERPADERPTAVFCANDLLAMGVLQELTQHRIRVPEDIAIVGYDDLGWAGAAAVPLTSVRQPREQLGRAATRLVMTEIDEGSNHQHQHVTFQPELIVRASSRTAPSPRAREPRRAALT
jgi:LacI family transcriptional regulator